MVNFVLQSIENMGLGHKEHFNRLPNKPWFLRVYIVSLLKTLRENARNEQVLLFPQCFLPVSITFCHFHQIRNSRLQTLSAWKSLKFVVW